MFGPMKLTALIKLDEQDKALEYAKNSPGRSCAKEAQGMNGLAWAIVDPDAGIKPSSKLVEFAVETARRADELADNKDAAIADTLAKAYFDSSAVSKAVETECVRLAKESGRTFDRQSSRTAWRNTKRGTSHRDWLRLERCDRPTVSINVRFWMVDRAIQRAFCRARPRSLAQLARIRGKPGGDFCLARTDFASVRTGVVAAVDST